MLNCRVGNTGIGVVEDSIVAYLPPSPILAAHPHSITPSALLDEVDRMFISNPAPHPHVYINSLNESSRDSGIIEVYKSLFFFSSNAALTGVLFSTFEDFFKGTLFRSPTILQEAFAVCYKHLVNATRQTICQIK